jgi:hypothetical protein
MKRSILKGLLVGICLCGLSACRSFAPENTAWRKATLLVLGEGTAQELRLDGEALGAYLKGFSVDDRTGYRSVEGSRTGFLLVDGLRYRVTASRETGGGRELLTIHSGSTPLHLKK